MSALSNQINLQRDVASVVIVEDNIQLADTISRQIRNLKSDTIYQTTVCYDVRSAEMVMNHSDVDIFIVDLELPKDKGGRANVEHGKALLEKISRSQNSAVLIYSGEVENEIPQEFFDLGAIDVIKKWNEGPKYLSEKLNSIWRMLKKTKEAAKLEPIGMGDKHQLSGWNYEVGSRYLSCEHEPNVVIPLTAMEDALLGVMLRSKNRTVSRDQIYTFVLRMIPSAGERAHSSLVAGLRKKLPKEFDLVSGNTGKYQLVENYVGSPHLTT